jgi:DNA-binding response OmpR family regulator
MRFLIILLTAKGRNMTGIKGTEVGAEVYMTKPYERSKAYVK